MSASSTDMPGAVEVVRRAGSLDGHVPPAELFSAATEPAGVLLVDTRTGEVVQANPPGRALTCGVALPLTAERWVAAAGLRTPAGADFAPGADPLSRAARGDVVPGEAVLAGGRTRWVTGVPVPQDGPSAGLALVVLLDVATGAHMHVRDRAVVAAGLSFTISDPRLPDSPLVFVNPAFQRTTGYSPAEAEGRNCRFLQGPGTEPAAVQRIRDVLRERRHESVTLLNYRKDGTPFWNEVSLSPVYDAGGELTHFVGIQADVTRRVEVDQERARHLDAERAARADAERAQRRLALLAEATSMLASTLEVDESLDRLTSLVVPTLADFCTVHLVGADGVVQRVAARHRDTEHEHLLRRLEELQPTSMTDSSHTAQLLAGGPALLVDVDEQMILRSVADPELQQVFRELAARSAMFVPLRARRQVLGVLALFADGSGRTFDEADLVMAADLARRAAVTVDNARLYEREHAVAEQLQRSLLPVLPDVAGIEHAARYLPGATAAQVGGDWYDLLELPDGAVGIAVGDVMGHDLQAAAAMGQLRSVLQSYAWQGGGPSLVLDRLDDLVQGLAMAQLATCVYGRLTRPTDGHDGELVLANAGHLPPALRGPDGAVRLVATEPDLLVGAALGTRRSQIRERVPTGSVLVLYTDGLIEQRERSIDEGVETLRTALAAAPEGDAEAIADSLIAQLSGGEALQDDVALLVVRVC